MALLALRATPVILSILALLKKNSQNLNIATSLQTMDPQSNADKSGTPQIAAAQRDFVLQRCC